MIANATGTGISTSRVRKALCRSILQWCEQGVNHVKVRVNVADEEPQGVWFYGRVANHWLKLDETVEGAEFARQIAAELDRLAASPHEAEYQLRRKGFRDRVEYEIKFHHDKIVAHAGKRLRSYLEGVLFGEGHAAPSERRQAIRRGPKSQVARC